MHDEYGAKQTVCPALSALHKSHTQLAPTADELTERQRAYLNLLSHPTEHVVGFALKMLASLDKHRRLDTQAFIDAVGPVLQLRYKSRPVAALRLLKSAIDQHPNLVEQPTAISAIPSRKAVGSAYAGRVARAARWQGARR